MKAEELENRFTYHAPDSYHRAFYKEFRDMGKQMAEMVDGNLPDCREKSLAMTKIEEAIMWANAGLARRVEPE